jgi:hypothetical protein
MFAPLLLVIPTDCFAEQTFDNVCCNATLTVLFLFLFLFCFCFCFLDQKLNKFTPQTFCFNDFIHLNQWRLVVIRLKNADFTNFLISIHWFLGYFLIENLAAIEADKVISQRSWWEVRRCVDKISDLRQFNFWTVF